MKITRDITQLHELSEQPTYLGYVDVFIENSTGSKVTLLSMYAYCINA